MDSARVQYRVRVRARVRVQKQGAALKIEFGLEFGIWVQGWKWGDICLTRPALLTLAVFSRPPAPRLQEIDQLV